MILPARLFQPSSDQHSQVEGGVVAVGVPGAKDSSPSPPLFACPFCRYTSQKSKKNTPGRMELMKYNKYLRR